MVCMMERIALTSAVCRIALNRPHLAFVQTDQSILSIERQPEACFNSSWLRFDTGRIWRQVKDGSQAAASGCGIRVASVDVFRLVCASSPNQDA